MGLGWESRFRGQIYGGASNWEKELWDGQDWGSLGSPGSHMHQDTDNKPIKGSKNTNMGGGGSGCWMDGGRERGSSSH